MAQVNIGLSWLNKDQLNNFNKLLLVQVPTRASTEAVCTRARAVRGALD